MRPLDLLTNDPVKMQILLDQLYKDPASLDDLLEHQRGQKQCLSPDVLEQTIILQSSHQLKRPVIAKTATNKKLAQEFNLLSGP